ncbi:MAG: Bax inhibitor-1/YccA family protein [Treponema sp.]|nr:Bax inhibitor-1/YccA family protein [Treponema sp.]
MANYITMDQAQPDVQRRFMAGGYLRMVFALAVTGAVAFGIAYCYTNNVVIGGIQIAEFYALHIKQLLWGAIIGELAVVIYLDFKIRNMSLNAAAFMLFLYSLLNGIFLSVIFLVFQITSIYKIFLVTCLMFLGMSIYGATTKTDLRSAGRYLMMALIGLIITGLLNFLFKSSTLDWIISVISVGVFVGLTAYDTQKLLKIGVSDNGSDSYKKIAILGALNLYIDFVNIFLNLLRLTGKKK